MLVVSSQLPSFHRDLDPDRGRASQHPCGPGPSSIGIIDMLYYKVDTLSPSRRQTSVNYFHRTYCWYRRVCTVHSIDNLGRCRLLAMFLPGFCHWIGWHYCGLHESQRGHNDHGASGNGRLGWRRLADLTVNRDDDSFPYTSRASNRSLRWNRQ